MNTSTDTSDLFASIGAQTGTYALILRCPKKQVITVGKLGRYQFSSGFYVYVGSAFGSGGLRARVGRHLRSNKTHRWHIDYIRTKMDIVDTWYTVAKTRQECPWSNNFITIGGQQPINGFGASDCHCESHLIHFKKRPSLTAFKKKSTVAVNLLVSGCP